MELEPLTLFEIIIVIFFTLFQLIVNRLLSISVIRQLLVQFADY